MPSIVRGGRRQTPLPQAARGAANTGRPQAQPKSGRKRPKTQGSGRQNCAFDWLRRPAWRGRRLVGLCLTFALLMTVTLMTGGRAAVIGGMVRDYIDQRLVGVGLNLQNVRLR